MKRKKSKKKRVLFTLLRVFALLLVAWGSFSVILYNENVNQRFESDAPLKLQIEDFDGLQCTPYAFPSNKGQMLAGFLYSFGEDQRGIILLAHGFGGGGHNSYMDCANYFARHGYYVFAFDATGNDESEGKGVGGLSQGLVDLDYAISFVEKNDSFPDLPIGLFGHSWGGHGVCSVLQYHPEVKAVIACCGYNRSSDLLKVQGKQMVGDVIYTMMPFIDFYEWAKYKDYAESTVMDGFASSDAAVLIAHSENDTVVPIQYGYDLFYEKYKDNPRFTFLRFRDRGHVDFLLDPKNTYTKEFYTGLHQWMDTLDYDYNQKTNKDRFLKERAEYIRVHLDRVRWSHRLDENLFGKFLSFYDQHME